MGGHSLFVGGGVIASLFHRNELIIVFLDFLVFETCIVDSVFTFVV